MKKSPITFRVELRDIKPLVWRRIIVASAWSMANLHSYLQWVMSWQDSHTHEFRIGTQIIAPAWWIKEVSHDSDTGNYVDERRITIATAVNHAGPAGEFEYLYDMGDHWSHRLIVEVDGAPAKLDSSLLPLCTAGENAAPPDDVGGSPGYASFLEALADRRHEEC